MKLELSNGTIVEPPTIEDIDKNIRKVGNELEHLILSDGDDYIQTAGEDGSLLLQYQDSTGFHESSRDNMGSDEVIVIFQKFLNGDGSWKSGIDFQSTGSESKENYLKGSNETSEPKSDSFLDEVTGIVKSEAMRAVKRFIRKIF